MVKGIPVDWDAAEIRKRFSVVAGFQDSFFVKNSSGQPSGKVVVTYASKQSAEQCISQFNNRAVDNLVC
jgi:hypothetical protein